MIAGNGDPQVARPSGSDHVSDLPAANPRRRSFRGRRFPRDRPMSRRQHHGHGHRGPRHDAGRGPRPVPTAQPGSVERPVPRPVMPVQDAPAASFASPRPPVAAAPSPSIEWVADPPADPRPANGNGSAPVNGAHADVGASGATAPQFRRFIKSRAYVPMHELRRRFGINGMEDDVTPVDVNGGWIYVGLPEREGLLLGELLRAGDVGYELSLDPCTPIVIGVYPMRPVPRH